MVYLILIIILLLIISIILYKILKSILKFIISISLILIIIFFILSLIVYKDINNIKENINNPILIFLEDKELITGSIIKQNSTTHMKNNEIQNYRAKEPKEVLGSNFKVIIINMKFIEDSPLQTISDEDLNINITKQEIINTLKSETATDHFLKSTLKLSDESISLTKQDLSLNNINDDTQLKAAILIITLKNHIKKNPDYIIKSYKNKNIRIYKETITFKLIKIIPTTFLTDILQKLPA